MGGKLRFRKDLYEGTAEDYDRTRPPYPAALLDDLRARVPLDGSGRLLDLGCGTGQVAFALAGDVDEVTAVDQEAGSVAFAARKADRLGVSNVRWIADTAEDVPLDGAFRLVTIGSAFHRLDRGKVAKRLVPHLMDGGCVALLWGATPTHGDEPWQLVMREAFEQWIDTMDARDRVPAGWEEAIERDPYEQVLRRAGLSYEGKFEFSLPRRWDVESLIGFAYSTSFINRLVLGDRSREFEADLRTRLLTVQPDGVFEQELSFAYELARRAR